MSERPAAEFLPLPPSGRRFSAARTVRLGDVDPSGALRLDAIARYLQDVASDDALDAGLPNALGWVVRRTMIRVDRPAEMSEPLELTTFCTGSGRYWAERRTSIGGRSAAIEAVSLWVQVDVATGRPARLGDEFFALYGAAAGGRLVSSKLSLPSRPATGALVRPWTVRRTDIDQLGHVNNAAHWAVVEEVLQERGTVRTGLGEIEYLAPIDLSAPPEVFNDDTCIWIVVEGRTLTAARWLPG